MKIHIKSRYGLYTVEKYGRNSITLSTKHNTFSVPVDDFKSMAGGNWNFGIPQEDIDTFLSIVAPDYVKKQRELDSAILELARAIDASDRKIKEASLLLSQESDDDYDYSDYEMSEPTVEQYEKWWRQESDKNSELNKKMRKIAHEVYSQNLDFSNFTNRKGIKFIIQQNWSEESYRLCWDPYGFVSNGHSDISSIFQADGYGTINGGWIKIFENDVVLYYKSGDYGVYDDAIAIECAKVIFPNKQIYSHAGLTWDEVEKLGHNYFDLPF